MSLLDKKTLYVDIGNSTISWKIDDDYHSVEIKDFQSDLISQYHVSIIACVANHDLIRHFINPTIVQPKPYKGIVFDYNLEQLGVDRFLGLVAGVKKYPKQDFMLVDIGTFVTIDIVQNGKHIDGGIAPGLYQLQTSKIFAGDDSKKSWKIGTENMLHDYIAQRCEAFQGKILITGCSKGLADIKQGEYYQNLVIEGLEIINE